MSETKVKGRKFIALQEGIGFGVLYIIACSIKPELVKLSSFAVIVVGLVATYMTANAIKAIKEKK